jgi:threonine dehydratase
MGNTVFEQLKSSSVVAAAKRIAPHIKRTSLVRSETLSRIAGGDVFLKHENEQITGSFKLRGALNALSTLSADKRARGVVTSSAGNHGMGVAYAAKTLGIKAKIFVPLTAPEVKKKGIRALDADLDDSQPDYDAAMDAAKAFGKQNGREYINPCLGDELLAGQGTVALEITEQLPALKSLVVNVGGGGLLGGCASFIRNEKPSVRIYGAQSTNTAAMSKSLAADRVVDIPSVPTLADGLAGQIDADALDIGKHSLDKIVTLTEDEIADTIAWFAKELKIRVEGAGACAAGAILHKKLRPETPCAVVISGGNIDESRWRSIIERPSQSSDESGQLSDRSVS